MSNFKIDKTWTLFLDRDGVINERNFHGYIEKVEDFVFLPKAIEGLKELATQFSRLIVVTNQQGVGKGVMTMEALFDIHDHLIDTLSLNGVELDAIYVAANLKDAEGDRRKPNTAMGLEAKTDFPEIDFEKSIMVGDTASDIQFGMNLGMKTVLVRSKEPTDIKTDIVVNNLLELADELKS